MISRTKIGSYDTGRDTFAIVHDKYMYCIASILMIYVEIEKGTRTRMYQEVSKWVVNGLYWSYNLLTNLLLTSWDIQVDMFDIISELSRLPGCFIETILILP